VRNRGTQPTVTSRHIGALVLAGLSLAACSVQQLKDNTLDIGGSVGSIYTSQIIGNLESLDRNLNAMPSLFSLSSGGIHTTNNINPSLTVPLGNTVTRTVVSNGVSQIVAPYNSLGIQASEGWEQTWNIVPEKDPTVLRVLRAVYLYSLGKLDAKVFDDIKDDSPTWEKAAAPQTGLGNAPITRTTTTGKADKLMPNSGPSDSHDWRKQIDDLKKELDATCAGGACFQFLSNVPCPSSPSDDVVCIGRYGTLLDRVTQQRELMMPRNAYNKGVLFDIVLFSLRFEAYAGSVAASSKGP
jgi:hypothetical protein